jgi:hypothetical protein
MRKPFTGKKTKGFIRTALLALAMMNLPLNADSQILWGAGSSNTASDEAGRFAKNFGTENGWTATGVSSPEALWTRTTTGVSQGTYWLDKEPFKSPGLSDGAALFDADYMTSKASLTAPQKGELKSPSIDLTGLSAGDAIQAKIFLYYRLSSFLEFSLGFSSDGGKNWKNYPLDIAGNSANTIYGQNFIKVRLTGATNGVTDFSDCRLRLLFEGNYYYAMADDISIEKVPVSDIAFPVFGEYNFQSTISPSPYAQIPVKYGTKATDHDFMYSAVVVNRGSAAIPTSANAKITCELLKSSGGSWNSLFKKDIAINKNIPAFDTVVVSGDITADFNAAFAANGAGNYRFTYHASSNLADGDAGNNDRSHDFTVTDDQNSLFSAVPLNNEGKPTANFSTFPTAQGNDLIQEFEQGVYFYFPDQTELAIESVNYNAFVPSNAMQGKYPVTVKLFSIEDSEQTSFESPSSIAAIGFDTVSVNDGNLGKYQGRQVTVYDVSTLKAGHKLNSKTGFYYVSVHQANPDGLGVIDGTRRSLNPAGYVNDNLNLGKKVNYLYNMRIRYVTGRPNEPLTTWNYVGYTSYSFTPSIALKLISSTTLGMNTSANASSANSSDEKNAEIFPNPVSDVLKMSVQLNERAEEATFILTNAQGMVLGMESFKQVQKMEYSLNTANLEPGIYYLHLRTDQGNIAKKFIKH